MMRTSDLQKVFALIHEAVAESFSHLAARFADVAEDVGDELEPLRDFAKKWSGLGDKQRKVFVEQLLKSAGLVAIGVIATKVGLQLAGKKQKQIRKALLGVADLIEPVVRKTKKKGKKTLKAAKKKLKAAA